MSYFRPTIGAMTGYVPGEQLRTDDYLKLNTNENSYPPSPRVLEAIAKAVTDRLRLYPDPAAIDFRETASKILGVPPDWILACNGSDDALTILTRACVSEPDRLVAPIPSYPLYRVLAQIQGCQYEERWFEISENSVSWSLPKSFCDGARLAFVPNPNSPTGTVLAPEKLLELAKSSEGLLVVDEAYVDFADSNCLELLEQCDRLVVTRSMSKSYSLAGIRFGFVVAQPVVITALSKVKDSYNCDALSLIAAAAAMQDQEYFRKTILRIRASRRRLEQGLAELGFAVTPSQANFVWVRGPMSLEPVRQELKNKKILVRYLNYPGYGEGLRITVGTDPQTDRLLEELRDIVR